MREGAADPELYDDELAQQLRRYQQAAHRASALGSGGGHDAALREPVLPLGAERPSGVVPSSLPP